MRVLWITNMSFPEAYMLLKGEKEVVSGGGWMVGGANALIQQPKVNLTVAAVSDKVYKLTRLEGKKITYYLIPIGKGNEHVNHAYEPYWREVRDAVIPDVVHIHGTELSHGLAYIEACGAKNVCVSIQGLTSVYYRYYLAGLSRWEILMSLTPASLYKGTILGGAKRFKERGLFEREMLRRVEHIIGRTSWDKAHAWAINPDATYHYGGEILRSDFYEGATWNYANCKPHSIFVSQAIYPIKGLHKLLEAMPLVLRHYPDATVRVAKVDITRSKNWKERIKLSDYGNIIRKMIKKYHLQKNISFTGVLDGDGMRKEYLQCNVFVCPSSIENSPNSLAEAQILGVPIIASYEGGVMDMMKGDEEHMYRFEETEILAHKIVQMFDRKGDVDTEAMRQEALRRHDPSIIAQDLIKIYDEIINIKER